MRSFNNIQIDKNIFTIEFLFDEYAQAKSLDDKYIIVTNVEKERLPKEQVKKSMKI